MQLIIVRLGASEAPVDQATLRALVLQAAVPGDGLEHVYVATDLYGADLVFFISQPTVAVAEAMVAELCRRVINASSRLRGWIVERCVSGLVPGGEEMLMGDLWTTDRLLPLQDPDSENC